jgi:hypothetical protein
MMIKVTTKMMIAIATKVHQLEVRVEGTLLWSLRPRRSRDSRASSRSSEGSNRGSGLLIAESPVSSTLENNQTRCGSPVARGAAHAHRRD